MLGRGSTPALFIHTLDTYALLSHSCPNAPHLLHTVFTQHKYEEYGLKPYVAHATFQYSGTPGKRNRFREALLWDDPPEYFDHPKGFIHFK